MHRAAAMGSVSKNTASIIHYFSLGVSSCRYCQHLAYLKVEPLTFQAPDGFVAIENLEWESPSSQNLFDDGSLWVTFLE